MTTSAVGARLRSIVERVERLEEEARTANAAKSDVYQEARSAGFNVKAIKAVVARRRKSAEERSEHDEMVDLYEREVNGDLSPRARERARTQEEARDDLNGKRGGPKPRQPAPVDPFGADEAETVDA